MELVAGALHYRAVGMEAHLDADDQRFTRLQLDVPDKRVAVELR